MTGGRGSAAGWVLALAGVTASAQGPAAVAAMTRGAAAMRAGDPVAAAAAFREAARLAPHMAEAQLDLGLALGRGGHPDEAIAALRQAIALNRSLPDAHLFLGVFLSQRGDQDAACAEFEAAIKLDPAKPEPLVWLGRTELAAGRPERATAPLDRAGALAPDDPDVLELRGRAHQQVATASYKRLRELEPDSWRVHRANAELASGNGFPTDAVTEYRKAIERHPGDPDLLEALGDQYRALNQSADAETAYVEASKLNPGDPVLLYDLGAMEIERGETDAGVEKLRRMVAAMPRVAVARYFLGRGLAAQGKTEEAIAAFQTAVGMNRDSEVAKRSLYELIRLYRKAQRPTDEQAALARYNELRDRGETRDWQRIDGSGAAPAH